MRAKVKLVFDDWRRWVPDGHKDESIYNTTEGVELSVGDLHHGATFNATIEVNDDDAARLASAMSTGAVPIFRMVPSGPCIYIRKPRKYVTGPLATGKRGK